MPESFNESHAEQMVIDACVAAGWKYVPADDLPVHRVHGIFRGSD